MSDTRDVVESPDQRGPTVVFIAGTGRSGSTLLANALGSVDGLWSGGEIRYTWERGVLGNDRCGCGAPFAECQTWQSVLATAFGQHRPEAAGIVAAERRWARARQLPILLASRRRPGLLGRRAGPSIEAAAQLYRAIHEVTGARFVVDSSKLPSYGHLLHNAGLDVRVLHLVRDARGSAFSWTKQLERTDRSGVATMGRKAGWRSAVDWACWNAVTELLFARDLSSYRRVRYEDLVNDPAATLQGVLTWLGTSSELSFVGDRCLDLVQTHTVAGNPNRMTSGRVALGIDEAWRARANRRTALAVTLIAAPLLHRYGYDLSAQPRNERVEDMPPLRRTRARVSRNIAWIHGQGWAAVAEEHDVHPVSRTVAAAGRAVWRQRHGEAPGKAVPVYLVGVQRSGTNMLARGIGARPEVEVHNENDRSAFQRYKLRDDEVVRSIVEASRHRLVLFKPLCDSHRVDRLLDDLGTTQPGRAIWIFRDVDARARSAVAKFGDSNLAVLRDLAQGEGLERWQVQRLSDSSRALIHDLAGEDLSAESGAALFWYVRNMLYFELGLADRDDVRLASYDDFVRSPETTMAGLCEFLDLDYNASLIHHMSYRGAVHVDPLPLHPVIRERCSDLGARLEDAVASMAGRG